jgi:hypothetical protein
VQRAVFKAVIVCTVDGTDALHMGRRSLGHKLQCFKLGVGPLLPSENMASMKLSQKDEARKEKVTRCMEGSTMAGRISYRGCVTPGPWLVQSSVR